MRAIEDEGYRESILISNVVTNYQVSFRLDNQFFCGCSFKRCVLKMFSRRMKIRVVHVSKISRLV